MKKGIIISILLITGISLTCIGSDITVKVGAWIRPRALTVQNIQNLSFGNVSEISYGSDVTVNSDGTITTTYNARTVGAHPGIIKITGEAGTTIAISSTPPTALVHTKDPEATIPLQNRNYTKIVYSDGSEISNMNNIPLTNGELSLNIVSGTNYGLGRAKMGEYMADWPISVIYSGVYADDYSYEPQNN